MAKKTVLKNMLSTWGILSVELQNALKVDQAVIKTEDGEVDYPDFQDANVLTKEEERMMQMIDAAETLEELQALAPNVMESMGERYRNKLDKLAAEIPVVVVEEPKPKKASAVKPEISFEYFKMKVDACKTYQEYQVLLPEAKDQEKQDYLGKKMNEFVDSEMDKEAKDSSDLTGLFANE
jgi:hypothetical protein